MGAKSTVEPRVPSERAPVRRATLLHSLSGVLLVATIAMIQAGGLISAPLRRTGLLWPVYLMLLIVGIVAASRTHRWRAVTSWGFVVTWGVLWAWMPYALKVAPDAALAQREASQLGFCAVLSCAALLLGLNAGPFWARSGWVAGLAVVVPIAAWELTTGNHLWTTPANPFPYPEPVAVTTFQNPNNFGIVLLSMLVALLALRADTRSRVVRHGAAVCAVVAVALVLASESRAALLGLVLVACLEARRISRAHPQALREALRRHKRAAAICGAVGAIAVAAAFLVPALARHNPVYQMLYAAIQPTTGTSDRIRLQLIGESLAQLRDSHFLGTGAGAFEPLLWTDPTSPITLELNLHNAFAELLSQYGVIVFLPFTALLCLLVAAAWRTRLSAAVRPRVAVVRTEMLGHLVVFVVLGITASSALPLPVWWLMLANACVCAADLGDRTRPSTRGEVESDPTERAAAQARQSRRVADQFGREATDAAANAPDMENSPADETASHLTS